VAQLAVQSELVPNRQSRGPRPPWGRLLMTVMGAFVGLSSTWIACGVATPGDFFASGSSWLIITLGVAAIGIARVASRIRSTVGVMGLTTITLCCAIFWMAAPDGWWASEPPHGSSVD
jgi:hypothetical protein